MKGKETPWRFVIFQNNKRHQRLPDDRILDWSKLKQIPDDNLSTFKMENKYHIG